MTNFQPPCGQICCRQHRSTGQWSTSPSWTMYCTPGSPRYLSHMSFYCRSDVKVYDRLAATHCTSYVCLYFVILMSCISDAADQLQTYCSSELCILIVHVSVIIPMLKDVEDQLCVSVLLFLHYITYSICQYVFVAFIYPKTVVLCTHHSNYRYLFIYLYLS